MCGSFSSYFKKFVCVDTVRELSDLIFICDSQTCPKITPRFLLFFFLNFVRADTVGELSDPDLRLQFPNLSQVL